MRPIALLTDFGTADHYVGVLHAVLARDAPGVQRIDLGHEVPLLTGSSGLLELAVDRASAADHTGLRRGETVEITSSDPD